MRHVVPMAATVFALASAAQAVVLNFEELSSTTAYAHGSPVPANARLSNQYLATHGILFSSGSPYVAVGNYGSSATSGTNAIAGNAHTSGI
jgi:hypothetical protein